MSYYIFIHSFPIFPKLLPGPRAGQRLWGGALSQVGGLAMLRSVHSSGRRLRVGAQTEKPSNPGRPAGIGAPLLSPRVPMLFHLSDTSVTRATTSVSTRCGPQLRPASAPLPRNPWRDGGLRL